MRVNVYIRKEHEETWDKIENKSEWVNDKLEAESPAGVQLSKPVKSIERCTGHSSMRFDCGRKGCEYA